MNDEVEMAKTEKVRRSISEAWEEVAANRYRILGLLSPIVLLPVLLLLVGFIPNSQIVSQLAHDAKSGVLNEKNWPKSSVFPTNVTDRYSECIEFGIGLGNHFGQGPVGTFASDNVGTCVDLFAFVQNQPYKRYAIEPEIYSRFWHGVAVISRPAIALGGSNAARLATGIVLLAGFVTLVWGFAAHRKSLAAIAAVIAFTLISDFYDVAVNAASAMHFGIGFAGCGITAYFFAKGRLLGNVAAITAGFGLAFFSQAFNQIGFAAFVWFVGYIFAKDTSRILIRNWEASKTLAMWIFGILLAFSFRLLVWTLWASPNQIWQELKSQILLRTLGICDQSQIIAIQGSGRDPGCISQNHYAVSFIDVFTRNFQAAGPFLKGHFELIVVVLFMLCVALVLAARKTELVSGLIGVVIVILIGTAVTMEHSFLHIAFYPRNFYLLMAILAASAAIWFPRGGKFDEDRTLAN